MVKKKHSVASVLSQFTEEMGKASKSFMEEFTEAVKHDPILGRKAENFAYEAQTKASNLGYKIGKGFKDLDAKFSGTSAVEREAGKLADSIEHSAGNLAKDIDRFARKNLGINLEKVGKAFGNFFEKLFEAIANLVSGIKDVVTSKSLTQAVEKTQSTRRNSER